MALSDEQNAMLRLLAQGEQGYGDIAALMGLGEDEVRAKVVGALAQLEAEGKPAPDVPPPIPGGAKPAAEVAPPEPEPVTEEPEEEDEEPAVAEVIAPQEPVQPKVTPGAKPKASSAQKAKAARAGKSKPASARTAPASPAAAPSGGTRSEGASSGGPTITLPTGRGAWLLGGGIIAAIAVIVVVVLLVSGGGSSSSTSTEGTTANAKSESGSGAKGGGEEGLSTAKEPTRAELTAVDGSNAKGLATFGRVKNKLALQIEATGLEPTTEGTDSYTVWLAQSPKKMLPLASTAVKGSGKGANEIAAQFEVPVEVLAYLANGTFDQITITKTDNKQFEATIAEATKSKKTPAYTGEPIMRGTIVGPIIGVAKREEEEQKGE